MVRLVLYKKFITRLLILVCLLIGVGNGLFWCQESDAYSHIEYNPVGKCQETQDTCLPVDSQGESGEQVTLTSFSFPPTDCLDTLASHSHIVSQTSNDLQADAAIDDWAEFYLFPINNLPAAILSKLNLTAQPPPLQALSALRTVVLLN